MQGILLFVVLLLLTFGVILFCLCDVARDRPIKRPAPRRIKSQPKE